MGVASSCGKIIICHKSKSKKKQYEDQTPEAVQTPAIEASEHKSEPASSKKLLEKEKKSSKLSSNLLKQSGAILERVEDSDSKYSYFTDEQLQYYERLFGEGLDILKSKSSWDKKEVIKWREGEELGHGSFGTVVWGYDDAKGRQMAVKKVAVRNNKENGDKLGALQQEIEILSILNHENIVKYYGSERTTTSFNIFLEYIDNGSLQSVIEKYAPLSENLVALYTKQILQGLEYLHFHKVIHRDIKGANVLVDRKGICKLADFGTAKVLLEKDDQLNSLTGTANWMAPEVIQQSGYGRYADIWSLGCTVYEMLTGSPPWAELKSIYEVMNEIVNGDTLPLIPKSVSDECKDFLFKCLQRCPQDRANVYELMNHPFILAESNRKRDRDAKSPLLPSPGKRIAMKRKDTNNDFHKYLEQLKKQKKPLDLRSKYRAKPDPKDFKLKIPVAKDEFSFSSDSFGSQEDIDFPEVQKSKDLRKEIIKGMKFEVNDENILNTIRKQNEKELNDNLLAPTPSEAMKITGIISRRDRSSEDGITVSHSSVSLPFGNPLKSPEDEKYRENIASDNLTPSAQKQGGQFRNFEESPQGSPMDALDRDLSSEISSQNFKVNLVTGLTTGGTVRPVFSHVTPPKHGAKVIKGNYFTTGGSSQLFDEGPRKKISFFTGELRRQKR